MNQAKMEPDAIPFLVTFGQCIGGAVAVLTAGAAVQISQKAAEDHIRIFHSFHSEWFLLFTGLFVLEVAALVFLCVARLPALRKLFEHLEDISRLSPAWRVVGLVGLAICLPVYSIVTKQSFFVDHFNGSWVRTELFFFLALAGTLLLKLGRARLSWSKALASATLVLAFFHSVWVSASGISNYPFSLTWSEISRFYDASLFLAGRIYGQIAPLPMLHPSYDLLLVLPYLAGTPPIWVLRLWDFLLQAGMTVALVFFCLKRLALGHRSAVPWLLAAIWGYLFLMQGPILGHLAFCAMAVVAFAAPRKFWRTTLVVALASVWAGISRINWFPVPGIFAACLFFLEVPLEATKRWMDYLWKPVFWFLLGTALALASNLLYTRWSGNGSSGNFVSSLTSDLLWYRLFPNVSYSLGVLPAILLASFPPVLFILLVLSKTHRSYHPFRWTGLLLALTVLFIGGLVVSVKIGGGLDLHNLDAYLILLMILAGYLFAGRMIPDSFSEPTAVPGRIWLAVLAVTVPVWFAIQAAPTVIPVDQAGAQQVVDVIRVNAEKAAAQGEQVLFISQRQLIALDGVKVPLVEDYEQDDLMEMVMSHNRPYLDQFQADLRARRFGVIVTFPQSTVYDQPDRPTHEESNDWVTEVSIPLLCYYQPAFISNEYAIAYYVPRQTPCK
jgi:hypothetical protein